MQEREIRDLIEDVRNGVLPRRTFIRRMVGLGLTAPMASMMLMHEGIAQTPALRKLDRIDRERNSARISGRCFLRAPSIITDCR